MTPEQQYEVIRHHNTDIRDHLPHFVDLVVSNGYRTVIELGVRSGVSTAAWLHALEQTDGHLWAVDIDPAPFEHERMTFIQGDDLSRVVYDLLPTEADIIFVDTSHTFEQTCAEIDMYLPRVRHYMLFHDTTSHPPVATALDNRLPGGWTNNPNCNGLGTVAK